MARSSWPFDPIVAWAQAIDRRYRPATRLYCISNTGGAAFRASGRKFFVTQFRANGRLRRTTLGPVTAFAPEEARRRAMVLLSEAKSGGDPAAQRDADRKAATVKALGERFLEEYVPAHCKPSTAYQYRRSVELFIAPRIGRRKVTEIQRSDIAELHHGLRKTPYQASER